jgi:DNA-binding CsgD family transcriptional regulator
MKVFGRDQELAELARLVDGVAAGGALVIEGEAGAGKSTLSRAVVALAERAGFMVLSCSGVQGQRLAGLAGLHELLHPVLDRVDTLPQRQRSAILTAFGLTAEPAPDRLLLSLATLGLLEEIASRGPLLLVVEDVQWLDASTAAVAGFLSRRLSGAPILLVATGRTGEPDPLAPYDLPRMRLRPLSRHAAEEVLTEYAPPMSAPARDRVLREAAGNPLALREFPAALRERGMTNSSALPGRLPLTRRLEQTFAAQIAALPAATRTLMLLLAAAEDLPPEEFAAAARRAGGGLDDLVPALDLGLLEQSGARISFRHPLIGSAVYGSAPAAERIGVHLRLAEAATEPDRAAWHRAAATLGQDEPVAADLEAVGERAVSRGAPADAARAFRRAGDLSAQVDPRVRRFASAAEQFRQAGQAAEAEAMVQRAFSETSDPAAVARLALVQGLISTQNGYAARNVVDLRTFVEHIAGPSGTENPAERLDILVTAAMGAHQRVTSPVVLKELDRELQAIDLGYPHPLQAMALAVLDPVAHGTRLRPGLKDLQEQLSAYPSALQGVAQSAEALQHLGVAAACWAAAVAGFRQPGCSADLATSLAHQGRLRVLTGQLADAAADLDTALRMAVDLSMNWTAATTSAAIARVQVWRGDYGGAVESLERQRSFAGASPLRLLKADPAWARGLLELTRHRYGAAWDELGAVAVDPSTGLWAIGDLTEAAVHSGHVEQGRELLAEAEAQNAVFGSDHLTMLLHRSRALLATGDEADERFRLAIRAGTTAGTTLELARTRLLHGEWLRRERRVIEAREPLGAALHAFEAAGARPWADRSAAELRAAGATPAGTPDPAQGLLTAQELQIARLAAAGMSNRDIADHVFVSHRTVGSHLYRIFPKLGITNRAQLRDALGAAGTPQATAR